jgi:hypothetical protein
MREMPSTPRRLARAVGCASSLGLAVLAIAATPGAATTDAATGAATPGATTDAATTGAATPGAAASAGETGCVLLAVHLAREEFWSLNRVSAGGVSCTAARGLVRSWVVAAAAGRIPGRVTAGALTPGHMIIFGRFGPPGMFEGYTCRWANVEPGPHEAFLPGKGRCSSAGAVVTWSFRAAVNPTLGQVRGCAGAVVVGRASVSTIRARTVSCARAKSVIRYLLVHRVIRPGPRGLRLVRARALGFRLSHTGLDVRAQHGPEWFSFRLYFETCGC